MCLEQRTVFLPRLAGILAECLLHWKEQFRRFIKRVIGPIDPQQDDEKQEGADSKPCRGWRSTDSPEKRAEILPPPMNEACHRLHWVRMVRASRAGVAARGHSGRVTKTEKFFLFEIVVWVCTTVL
jgi:hypothetical protein